MLMQRSWPSGDVAVRERLDHRQSTRRDDPKALRPGLAETLVEKTHAHEHKLFAGKCDRGTLGFREKWAVGMAGAREGDYRDWKAIDDWAATIAEELSKPRAS